jgi:RNA polymerase sigma-70 factor, ECF subfamily
MNDCDSLMRRVAGGDRAALATIFDLEAGRLIAIAKRIVRRRELAEEVVQEAFVTIWRKAALFDHERGAARAWMTTIVRHRALNIIRDGSRLDFHDADLPETEDLKRCLGLLEPQRRRSIVMAYVVGFSHGEIAAHLGAPVGTVKAWIRRGVAALKECLS